MSDPQFFQGPATGNELPLEVRKQIDAVATDFEEAWIAGKRPGLQAALDKVPGAARQLALRRLLQIEIGHRRDSHGEAATEVELLKLYSTIAGEIKQALAELRSIGTERAAHGALTVELPASREESPPTVAHTTTGRKSRGLHVRCPHCSNPVELLADTPFEDISCATCGSMFSLVDRDESTRMATPLKTIDRFDLVARLGVGGFGTVWKARDRDLDRIVAVKIPRRGQLSSAESEQFLREARSAAQLRHSNIVPVFEVGREGDTLFIVSEFVRGVTLSDWLTGHRPGFRESAELLEVVADALQHAHEHGIVHRDLKPSNVMLDETGTPHLMDFGLAKRAAAEVTMTMEGQIVGTPAYMSPEQAAGEGHWVDRRSDIYSLGVIMFELLTGELPYRGNAQMQVHQRLNEDAPDPRKLNRHIPRDLSTMCLKCLERAPGRRYQSAEELGEELRRYLSGRPIEARPISAPARALRWAQRKPLLATTAALVLFLAIAGPAAALYIERQRDRLEELVAEKDHLIEQSAEQKKADVRQIAELNTKLDAWEGRANPWELWPPAANRPPRKDVLAQLQDHTSTTLMPLLKSDSYSPEQQAFAYLGLATLADALSSPGDARKHYEAARELLLELRQKQPQDTNYARAYADCEFELARLAYAQDRAAASQHAEESRKIWQQLASGAEPAPADQVAWLEAELYCATLEGAQSPIENHLKRVAEIDRRLANYWPKEPDDLYRLACDIAKRQPVLDSSQ
jgi:hypothetical protein